MSATSRCLARCLLPLVAAVILLAAKPAPAPAPASPSDPFLWLESVNSPRAMAWVRAQNAATFRRLGADPNFKQFRQTALYLAQSKSRIPLPLTLHGTITNFWQDETHVQGLWRATTPASYATKSPIWRSLIDLDALSTAEHHHWVWKGATCAAPQDRLCLVALSEGGEDKVTLREFDTATASFVRDGFTVARAKTVADWFSPNAILVATDWGPNSMTRSGYPFILKLLRRGQPLEAARPYFQGTPADVGLEVQALIDGQGHHAFIIQRERDFFHTDFLLATASGPVPLNLPEKASLIGLLDDKLILLTAQSWPGTDGKPIPAGSLAALDLANPGGRLTPIFTPGPRQSVQTAATTAHSIAAVIEDEVRGRAVVFMPHGKIWSSHRLELPDDLAINLVDTNPDNDSAYFTVEGFLTPTTLYLANCTTTTPPRIIKAQPAQFNAADDVVDQHEATAPDGTKIPYFIVHPRDMKYNSHNPTLLYAYGGFQVSMLPNYSPILGKLWLERGGVYVLANIRGGGEFGPAWHEAALKTHRQVAYDDFAAVAEDLITTRVTDPPHLGIRGGSNGGLLMGVEFTQHPDLFGAVIIEVPLLDMLRYEKIAAGASWVAEYGSVSNPAERAFLARISPYQNLHTGVHYPEPFIFTTTRDDRVGPQHARKFAAKMASLGLPYYYYESTEGGHAAGANLRETAIEQALEYTYLTEKIMN